MMDDTLVELPVDAPLWDRLYLVFPLVLLGTRDPNGRDDFAPKHMAMPMSWDNWFGFVCTPRHQTWQNAVRTGVFTVSYPTPDQIVLASLAAAPRYGEDKPSLAAIPRIPASRVDGSLVEGCSAYLECTVERTVEDLGPNGLILGRIVAAHVRKDAMRAPDRDDYDLVRALGPLAFLHPNRFARIDQTQTFPFHVGWKR